MKDKLRFSLKYHKLPKGRFLCPLINEDTVPLNQLYIACRFKSIILHWRQTLVITFFWYWINLWSPFDELGLALLELSAYCWILPQETPDKSQFQPLSQQIRYSAEAAEWRGGAHCGSLSYSCFVDLSCHSSWCFSTPTWGSHSPLNTVPSNTSSVNSQPKWWWRFSLFGFPFYF